MSKMCDSSMESTNHPMESRARQELEYNMRIGIHELKTKDKYTHPASKPNLEG